MTINLLPPKIKSEKQLSKIANTAFALLGTILVILLILSGGIWTANFYAKKDLAKVNEKIDDQNRILARYKETEDGIKTVNSKLSKIDSASSQRILWSNLIVELSKSTPAQAQIKTLTLDQTNKKIIITGDAETRSDIAKFKEKMSTSHFFKNVTFSSSVHDESESNFSFNISSEIGDLK